MKRTKAEIGNEEIKILPRKDAVQESDENLRAGKQRFLKYKI